MACNLSSGKLISCKEQVGGIQEVFLSNAFSIWKGTSTFDANKQLTDVDPVTIYRYELKGTGNTIVENIEASEDNGTIAYTQELTIQLNGLTVSDRIELLNLAKNRRLIVFVRDNNDNIRMFGWDHGMEVSGGSIENGGSEGDFVGNKLTLRAMCKAPAFFVESFTTVPFDNIANITVSPAY